MWPKKLLEERIKSQRRLCAVKRQDNLFVPCFLLAKGGVKNKAFDNQRGEAQRAGKKPLPRPRRQDLDSINKDV
jgi:hypothetical protein